MTFCHHISDAHSRQGEEMLMEEVNLMKCLSYGINGTDGFPVTIEAYSNGGLPGMEIIGLPDASIKESKERVRAAVESSGYTFPFSRIIINLSPADTRKEGPSFDLPIAIAVMGLIHDAIPSVLTDTVLIGELSLDGTLLPVRGALPMVISAIQQGIHDVVLPAGNADEVSCIQDVRIYPAHHLTEVIDHITGTQPIPAQTQKDYAEIMDTEYTVLSDLSQVVGQSGAKRALEIAAAGGHNLLMVGTPGSGKTMLARCIPGILPPLTFEEALETTKIHSIAGKIGPGEGLMIRRPFSSPHHTASVASLIGGGSNARPGEVSLAHNGVLFLDEMPEFTRTSLEALRQPLEDGYVSVSRVMKQARYQSSFMLVAGMNPCPCGYFGSKQKQCTCTPNEIKHYLDKISGPLLDRIDLQIEVDQVPVKEINNGKAPETSAEVAARVAKARNIQNKRYMGTGIFCNAQLEQSMMKKYCATDEATTELLNMSIDRLHLSMRAYNRILKVARTIADLAEHENIQTEDVAEAIQYRELDSKYWG